jgi:ApaG protein
LAISSRQSAAGSRCFEINELVSCLGRHSFLRSGVAEKHEGNYDQLDGLSVRIDDVIYMPTLDAPEDKPHPFVYFITILNDSTERVRILGRKWIIREGDGEITVVEGDGVVGQTPVLEPGHDFSYNSYHVTAGNAEVSGAFFGTTATGAKVRVRMPDFQLELPDWA